MSFSGELKQRSGEVKIQVTNHLDGQAHRLQKHTCNLYLSYLDLN